MRTLSIFKTVSALAAASVLAVIASGGKASAITFNLGGPVPTGPQVASSFTYSEGGISLTATGAGPLLARNVFRVNDGATNNGLGVTFTNSNLENNQVDGFLFSETLTLAFNQAVNLTSVSFSRVGSNDDFTFLNNGAVVFNNQVIAGGNGTDTGTGTFNFASQAGTSFGFRAGQANDDFYVSSVEVTAVPEPITIAGMIMGSGFGVVLRRKYKKAAKLSTKMSS